MVDCKFQQQLQELPVRFPLIHVIFMRFRLFSPVLLKLHSCHRKANYSGSSQLIKVCEMGVGGLILTETLSGCITLSFFSALPVIILFRVCIFTICVQCGGEKVVETAVCVNTRTVHVFDASCRSWKRTKYSVLSEIKTHIFERLLV